MKINGPSFNVPIADLDNVGTGATGAVKGAGFGETVAKAIEGVEAAQQGADVQAGKLAQGEGNLHEAALSLEKADISMRLMVKMRNKMVEAYQEIMRMPV